MLTRASPLRCSAAPLRALSGHCCEPVGWVDAAMEMLEVRRGRDAGTPVPGVDTRALAIDEEP